MNYAMIIYILSWVLKIEGIAMLLPAGCALLYREGTAGTLIVVAALSILIGQLAGMRKPKQTAFYAREGFVTVAGCWVVLSLIGALPFYLTGRIPSYLDALFEIVSGFTTTGSSILGEVESLGKGLLFWRSFSHWIGGMGVLVLVLTMLPLGGGYNMMIMKAESPGPDVSKMVPRVADTAKELYRIYFVLTVIMVLSYLLSGMPLYDSLCIGFGTAGTGGFAIRNNGMADYSMLSQFLITVFMILFGVNFNVFYLLQKRNWRAALRCEEARAYLLIVLLTTIFLGISVFLQIGGGLLYSFHHAFFTVGSLITTTGFSTLNFGLWTQPAQMVLLILMLTGACAGSTGGGFKVSRLLILIKEMGKELHLIIHPQAIRTIRLEGKRIEHSVVRSVNCYLILYVFIFILSVFLISFDGEDFLTNFSAVAATFNNIGPGLGHVDPMGNFSFYSDPSKLILIFDMLAGRLEILPMLILFSPKTWRKTN